MRNIFERKPDSRSAVFAEAEALLDDGLDLDFVLGLFPDEAEWLGDELSVASGVAATCVAETPSYYFEASLKSRFIEAGMSRPAVPAPAAPPVRQYPGRTALATFSVAVASVAMGVLALGFVTAGNAVPGDWNYSFKMANERLQYSLSHGSGRVDVQIRQTESRVQEIRVLASHGDASPDQIQTLTHEVQALGDLAKTQPLDDVQKARILGLADTTHVVLNDARQRQPALDPSVNAATNAVDDVVTVLAAPASPTPAATATATASPTTAASPTPKPSATASPAASATATPPPATPSPTATATPSSTPSPTPTTPPSATPRPGTTPAPSETASPPPETTP
jgi:TolA-binding protein